VASLTSSTCTCARIARDRAVAERVERLHDYQCQVCGIRVLTAAGRYAEGAHIRGLGRPHDGSVEESNMDSGSFYDADMVAGNDREEFGGPL
jgi:predicted restriction endonuclease